MERGFSRRKPTESAPTLLIRDLVDDQGVMSSTFRGTYNGKNIIIKKICPEEIAEIVINHYEMQGTTYTSPRLRQNAKDEQISKLWKRLKNEINISTKLQESVNACASNSDIICYLGYASNKLFDPNDIPAPLINDPTIPMNALWLLYLDIGNNSLIKCINTRSKTPAELKAIITKILRAIKKIHDKDIVHLDIKPQNIMINALGNPVIIDLGFACSTNRDEKYACSTTTDLGSGMYRAPELNDGREKNLLDLKKADIYSLGVTIYICLSGKDTFVRYIFSKGRNPIEKMNPALEIAEIEIQDLVNSMLCINPNDRPTIQQTLSSWKSTIGDTSSELKQIRIAFIRHAISCSNAMRMKDKKIGYPRGILDLSKEIRDTPLSDKGISLAAGYSVDITKKLQKEGFNFDNTTFASSSLLRAQQTLSILFGGEEVPPAAASAAGSTVSVHGTRSRFTPYIFPFLKEDGAIPENTPNETSIQLPFLRYIPDDKRPRLGNTIQDTGGWKQLCSWLKENLGESFFKKDPDGNINIIIVGHGTYLSRVFAILNKPPISERSIHINNMDFFIIQSDIPTNAETPLKFYLTGNIIPSPLLSDEDIIANTCSAGGSEYIPFTITEDSNIFQYKEQLDTLFVNYLNKLGMPSSIPLNKIIDYFDNSFTLLQDLLELQPDINICTIFIKLYNAVKRIDRWPPAGYTGPPTYTIEGYTTETVKHNVYRLLNEIGKKAKPQLTGKEVYEKIKSKQSDGIVMQQKTINNLMYGNKEHTFAFDKEILKTGELLGNIILYNQETNYERFVNKINQSTNFSNFEIVLDQLSTVTEYFDYFYASDIVLTKLAQNLKDYRAQFFTVIDNTKKLEQVISGKSTIITVKDGRRFDIQYTYSSNGVGESVPPEVEQVKPDPPRPVTVNNTVYLQFKYQFSSGDGTETAKVGIIQGFKLHEFPYTAAALFLAPPVEMSEHAKTLLNAEWKITDMDSDEEKGRKIKKWVLEKTGLTEYQFSQKYQHILNNFQMQGRKLLFTNVADNKLNMLEVRSRISPTAVCGEILKKATGGDETAGQLKEALGAQIKPGIFGICPTKKQFQDAFNTVRTTQGLPKMTFVDDLVALRDIALTKLEKSVDLYDEFKRWLLAYNNTKRTANTSLFIPQIIELGSSIKSPLVSSTPFTVGYWRTEFTEKLSQIISLLKGDLPARIRSKIAEGRNTKIIEAMPAEDQSAALQARLPATREELSDADKAVLNLPANLDVVANLNEIDPKLAVQEVQNAPFQLKYVKNPNPAGIKVSDALKPIKSAGWFSSAQYPSKQSIKSTLGAVREAFGLPTEHAQDLTRILKFAKSPRAIDKKIFEKIEAYKDLHPEIDLSAIKKTSWGYPPPKKDMITKIESAMVATPRKLIQELSYSGSLGPRGAAGVGSSAAQPQSPIMGSKLNTKPQSQNDNQPHLLGGARIKTTAPTRKMKQRQQKQQKQQKQRGGGSPLAFFQEGAQMHGTYGSETGAGLGLMTDSMARSAITQTGGRKNRTRKQKQQRQRGGFSPGLMGSFAVNGLSLLPVAGYMSYKMMKGNKSRKEKRGATGRKRLTRRN